MSKVHCYIVMETTIENGDIDAARDKIIEASLGAMHHNALNVHESISLEPGNLQMRMPVTNDLWKLILNAPLED